jgi:hypothetical protein
MIAGAFQDLRGRTLTIALAIGYKTRFQKSFEKSWNILKKGLEAP